jgi:MFS family permease
MTTVLDRPTGREDRPTPLRHRVRGRVLLLLSLMYALSYLDRVNISTAGPTITAALHLSKAQFGLAISAFSLPYALTQVLGGALGDRLGARRMLGVVSLVWGVATVATGLAGGLVGLVAARAVLGLSEGAAFPTGTRAMSQWLPPDRRGFGQGAVHAASRLSNAVSPLLVALLIGWLGWRGSFLAAGVLSVAWAAVWAVWFRDRPQDHAAVGCEELEELVYGDEPPERTPTPWRALSRRLAPLTAVDFCYGWLLWVYLTWIPSLFADRFHLPLSKYALFASLTAVGGVLGDAAGGALSDRLLRRTGDLRRARRLGLQVGLAGSALFLVPAVALDSVLGVTLSLAAAFFMLELANSPIWAVPMDVAPEHAGAASGLVNTGFGVAGVLAPPLTGWLVDRTGSYTWPLLLAALLLLVGVVATRWVDPRQLDLQATRSTTTPTANAT